MGYQTVFKRYEIKYLVSADQKEKILKAMEPYMEMDRFGRSTVRNIYFDTDDFILARHSIAKPDFKEKLRIRSYSKATADSTVFVELKRKYDGVVYKRRVGLPETEAMAWMAGSSAAGAETFGRWADPACESLHPAAAQSRGATVSETASSASKQVASEINYFKGMYKSLHPVLYLSYDREAYRMKKVSDDTANSVNGGADETDGRSYISQGSSDFRVTFDSNILCRENDLSLKSQVYGTQMLDDGMYLMELKCSGAIPLWMAGILSEEKIYKTSFSKYGTAYCSYMNETPEDRAHAIAAAGYSSYASKASAANRKMVTESAKVRQSWKLIS